VTNLTVQQPARVVPVAAPLRRQVIEVLRESIATLELKPGERLVERDLCERLGVSRTVVREALRHLEAESLVDIIPNHGPVVSTTTLDDARQIYEAREALESFIARSCARRADEATLGQLRSSIDALESAHASSDVIAQLRAKDVLYRVMAHGAGNAVIGAMLPVLQVRVRLIDGLSVYTFGRHAGSLDELRAMVDAISERDGDRAAELAVAYVRAGATVLEHFAGTATSR
jgi:GntR family transcriptional regulator, trigonelline degradation regulator